MDTDEHKCNKKISRSENLPAVQLWQAGQKVGGFKACQLADFAIGAFGYDG